MEIICNDDSVQPEVRAMFDYWIEEGKMYNPIRQIKRSDGQIGLILEECPNKKLPHPSGLGEFEPSYNIKRFNTLNGDPLTKETVEEFFKSLKEINAKI